MQRDMKRILLVAFGTHGDVYPFVALAAALRQQQAEGVGGMDISIATLPQYEALVHAVGARFIPLASRTFLETFCAAPTAWSARDGLSSFFGEFLGQAIDPVCELLVRTGGEYALVLASVLALGARVAYDVTPFPLVTVCPYPVFFQSVHLPPVQSRVRFDTLATGTVQRRMYRALDVLSTACLGPPEEYPRLVLGNTAPLWQRRLFKRLALAVGDKALAPAVNATRAKHGLAPVRGVFGQALFSPRKILALFPEWFAPPQEDWPAQTEVCNFPELGMNRQAPSAALRRFLEQGPPPVVVTFGSCKQRNAGLFAAAASALRRLGMRGVFVSAVEEDMPRELPASILHTPFEPFPFLFRQAQLVVHHAGIGTCADGLRAGVPQLLVPFSYDQPDNATRLQRLGVGRIIAPGRCTAETLAGAMQRLMQREATAQACKQYADLLRQADAEQRAVRLVCQWMEEGLPAPEIRPQGLTASQERNRRPFFRLGR